MTMLKRNIAIALAAAALVAVTAIAATAQDGDSTPPGSGVPQATTIEEAAKDAAAILRTERTAEDAVRTELAEKIDEHGRFGVNTALSRLAIGTISNSLYLLPATGHVCAALTLGEGASMSCVPTDELAAGNVGPGMAGLPGGAIAIWGIVPDGVDSVTVAAGPHSTEVETQGNAYLAVVPAGAAVETATYTGPSGRMEYAIHDPAAPEPER
ncbi:MAG: hypothetical protein WD993_03585 [Thermoleophilaceae bacterium]